MARVKLLVIGAVAFSAMHVLFVETWQTWFDGGAGHPAWFMNSATTVAITAIAFAVINLIHALVDRDERRQAALVAAAAITVGATVPMVVVLFTLPGGPGTLFPIAIVIGAAIFFVSGASGGYLGRIVSRRVDS
jgi:VIT1/CCC1 family predicted Fe2+/Mn2+ transporter